MSPDAIFAMGAAALEAGDFRAAEQLFHQIVDANPRAHPAWNALSVVAVRAGLPDVAAEHVKRALELDRRNPVYLNNLAVALGELGEFAQAEDALRRALKHKPAYAEGQFNLGKVLHKLGRLDEALRAYERAFAMERQFPGLLLALLGMYRKTGHAADALAVLEEGSPGLPAEERATQRAQLMAELEGAERAVAWLREHLSRHPDHHQVRHTFAQLLLAQGHWREGWQQYLFRVHLLAERVDSRSGEVRLPPPLPARLDGRSVRLRREMGLGDNLFFLRFLPELRRRGALVAVSAPQNLARILPGDLEVIVKEEPVGPGRVWDHDLWICDLGALLEATDTPPALPLVIDAARVDRLREELRGLGPAPYLGLTWRAGTDVLRNREFGNDRGFLSKEVSPLAALGQAVRGWPGTLLALQRQPYAGEIQTVAAAAGAPVHDFSALNEDLPAMLALLGLIDEYVAVSNTNVHMLAGLGRTARVLVPYPPEWRWMREGASPWFPGFALYREPQARGWAEPLSRLRKDLIG
jgi:tetratricopeptide (TPR) repeat protein